jgi:hypothetical protein
MPVFASSLLLAPPCSPSLNSPAFHHQFSSFTLFFLFLTSFCSLFCPCRLIFCCLLFLLYSLSSYLLLVLFPPASLPSPCPTFSRIFPLLFILFLSSQSSSCPLYIFLSFSCFVFFIILIFSLSSFSLPCLLYLLLVLSILSLSYLQYLFLSLFSFLFIFSFLLSFSLPPFPLHSFLIFFSFFSHLFSALLIF